MTIGIDIRVLASGRLSGVEQYALNLLSYLIPLDKSIRYKLFYNGVKKQRPNWPFLDNYNVDLRTFNIPNRFLFLSSRILNYPKVDKLLYGADVFFSPHIFIAPLSKQVKKVYTVHDLSFEYFPEFLSKKSLFAHKYIFNPKKELSGVDKIISVSKSTRDDLTNMYGIPEQRIEVIYSGINQPEIDESRIPRIKEKYNLPENYILYLGTIEPRKNILGIVRAFELLKRPTNLWSGTGSTFRDASRKAAGSPAEQNQPLKLVLAGEPGWLHKPIYEYIKKSKFRGDILLPGFIPEEDKPYLYKLARAFVYPSFFEGFGFQVLEAASLGVPVITSNTSSLPEVIGSASLMADPYNPKQISQAIDYVLNNENLAKVLGETGRLKASKFTWQKSAEKTLELLTSI